ncbi:DUF1134 domain-containing protein [Hyphomicrobium sp. CS1BSMeth3]|uniref:DUF1134 domain-containing protein n=1 Tax=Hyphomicrobium sp. CS1BSMeth3 TaxID=1892844 RepID=UPI0009F8C8D3|nr:DUF1134 domain-containing protein [Hyphomicrobium sp. CS1BSMeth3]MBN9266625.1 DUF1134 domain-containing protein [Hyphomicrobium sp.]
MTTLLRLQAGALALGLGLGLGLTSAKAQIVALDQDGAPIVHAVPAGERDAALPGASLPQLRLAQAGGYVERESLDPPPYRPPYETGRQVPSYGSPRGDAYSPPPAPRPEPYYQAPPPAAPPYREAAPYRGDGYAPPPPRGEAYPPPPPPGYHDEDPRDGTYSMHEITRAGHGFFGAVSQGLASVIEYAFRKQGRPNGYILGEDMGGAFVAGLRYGRGTLYTRDAGQHPVYWQGPSIGYDAGGDGSKTMILVYRMRDPHDIYRRFAGVEGSAYVVGGVGINFQTNDDMVMAPIRSGIGLRMGANIGYLKYTRRPTWNPF